MTLRVFAVFLLLVAACSSPEQVTEQELLSAIKSNEMPDLRGWQLDEVGDQLGLLYKIHDRIGVQETVNIPSDSAPAGQIIGVFPEPGTKFDQIDEWTITISDGGPVVEFAEIGDDEQALARQYLPTDPDLLVARATVHGDVYKSDTLLFSLSCEALAVVEPLFLDNSYRSVCPN